MNKVGWVDGLTKFYNGEEWKCIKDYVDGEPVLVYDPETHDTKLEVPVEYNIEECNKFYKFWGNNFCECLSCDSSIYEEQEDQDFDSKSSNLASLLSLDQYKKWYDHNVNTENEWLLASKMTFKDGNLRDEIIPEPYHPGNFREIFQENMQKYNFVTSTGLFVTSRANKATISLGEKYA